MLVRTSANLFKKTAMSVAERCPDSVNSEEVADSLLKIERIVAFREPHIWDLARDVRLAVIHIVVDSKEHYQMILAHVHNLMISYGYSAQQSRSNTQEISQR